MEINFDVNQIVTIGLRPSILIEDYKWKQQTTIPKYKTILLIFKIRDGVEVKPEGFYEDVSYDYYSNDSIYRHVSEDYIIRFGYIIKDVGNSDGISGSKQVWKKPYVEVSLGYKSTIGRSFLSDQEAKDWVEKLKEKSNKTFEYYEY